MVGDFEGWPMLPVRKTLDDFTMHKNVFSITLHETYFVVDHMIGKLFFAQNIAVYDQSRILTMLIIETYLYETYKKQQKR